MLNRRLTVLPRPTFEDKRGVNDTFLPNEPLVEFNRVTLKAGQVRGMHWHPEFTEYLLFVSGQGIVLSRDIDSTLGETKYVGPGIATRAEPGVAHAVEAVTNLVFVAMLTKRWDDCHPPIMRCSV